MRYITDYQIRDGDGQIHLRDITDIVYLKDHISRHGVFDMQKVSFYVTDTDCPDEFRNVIVRNCGDVYVPEFCDDKKQEDWALVRNALANLDEFVRHIQQPVFDVEES